MSIGGGVLSRGLGTAMLDFRGNCLKVHGRMGELAGPTKLRPGLPPAAVAASDGPGSGDHGTRGGTVSLTLPSVSATIRVRVQVGRAEKD